MYYSYIEIECVATSFSPARTDLALKLLIVITLFGKVTWVSCGTSFPELIGTVGAVEWLWWHTKDAKADIKSPSRKTSVFAHTLVYDFSPIGMSTVSFGKEHVEHARWGNKNLKSEDRRPLSFRLYLAILPLAHASWKEYCLRNLLMRFWCLALSVSVGS